MCDIKLLSNSKKGMYETYFIKYKENRYLLWLLMLFTLTTHSGNVVKANESTPEPTMAEDNGPECER